MGHTFTNLIYVLLYTLPETNSSSLKINAWKMRFPFGRNLYFQGRLLLVSGGVDSIDTRPRWSLVLTLLVPHSWAAGHGKKFVWCTLWSWKIWKPSPRHRLGWVMESSGFATSKYRGTMEHTASYPLLGLDVPFLMDRYESICNLGVTQLTTMIIFFAPFFLKSDLTNNTNTRIFFFRRVLLLVFGKPTNPCI